MNLRNIYRRNLVKPINLYWWRYQYPDRLNFGDELTPYIISRLYGLRVRWAEPQFCDLAGAGSIIDILQEHTHGKEVHVWGSGFIKPGKKNSLPNLHFSAVRGKYSLERTNNKFAAMGDPGLLMPLVFHPRRNIKHRVGIVPHYVDQDSPALNIFKNRGDTKIINVFDPPEVVVSDILSCELIFSSSMHGLIISDAYGVPNYWTPFSNLLTGGDYKFADYYSVYDERPKPLAINKGELDYDELIGSYQSRSEINKIQQGLINSFPLA